MGGFRVLDETRSKDSPANSSTAQGHRPQWIRRPERLSGDLSAYWSRRIDEANRIVYRIENNVIQIVQCGSHFIEISKKENDEGAHCIGVFLPPTLVLKFTCCWGRLCGLK